MTARQKLENLTHSWYGVAVFGAICALFEGGIGFFSLLRTGFGMLVSFLVTFFLGRRLLAKSSFWRFVLVVFAGFGTVFGSLGVARGAWQFMHEWSFGLLFQLGVALVAVVMNAKSFRVLTDSSVKAYFG
ncbi:hypothetical protein [Labilithrix luteola]|nr:hypothetical protein [Labilithrix luteola]